MKLVLALAGSPRRGGNSETLLDEALAGVEAGGGRGEKFILNEMDISPCQECGGCEDGGACVIEDQMQLLYRKLDEAWGLIVASPIFFSGVSAQLKTLIDRCQAHWVRKYLLGRSPHRRKRPGAFICVRGQSGKEIFQAAARPVKAMFATEDFSYTRQLLVEAMDSLGAVAGHDHLLQEAYRLGKELLQEE